MDELSQRVSSLSDAERAELSELILSDPALSLWCPSKGPQAQAYASEADEMFYGGSAGGGKSALIIGLALTRHRRSLIIRRESTQMRGLIDDIAKTLGGRDGLSVQAGQWRIPREKALFPDQLIEFGGVPDPGSEEKHQGIPHDLLAFDEVTQLPEYIIDYLSTWNRTTHKGQRCRMILTSNPPTPSTLTTGRGQATGGGIWLIRRYAPWLDPEYSDPLGFGKAMPGELRWFVTIDGVEKEWPDRFPFLHRPEANPAIEETIIPKSRTFVPARVTDNPYLVDTDYVSTLQKLPEPLRSAMLYGDFSVALSDKPLQLIPTEWIREAMRRHKQGPRTPPGPMTALGVDVSRGGTDDSILFPRHGEWFDHPIKVPTTQTLDGALMASQVVRHVRDDAVVVVDANGVGASAYDHLKRTSSMSSERLKAYVGSTKSTRRDRSGRLGFTNLRSQTYWLLREALDPTTGPRLSLPQDDGLLEELAVLTFAEQNGKLAVMRKEDAVKLLGRSPDKADALAMAWSVHDPESASSVASSHARESRLADADFRRDSRHLDVPRHADGRRASWSDKVLPYPSNW